MTKRKEFGERNKNLCHSLLTEGQYLDWVVTTAFYSSIHFVEDHILPTQVNGHQCDDISDVKNAFKMEGRHAARERLVFEKTNYEVGARYKWLDDHSRTARYKTYKILPAEADKAKIYLNYIHAHCYPQAKETAEK